jgi:hypothetical protein
MGLWLKSMPFGRFLLPPLPNPFLQGGALHVVQTTARNDLEHRGQCRTGGHFLSARYQHVETVPPPLFIRDSDGATIAQPCISVYGNGEDKEKLSTQIQGT